MLLLEGAIAAPYAPSVTWDVTNCVDTLVVDPFVRLLELLWLLQSGGARNGDELAQRFGVGLRTIRRDIGRLRDAGFAVEATPGLYGGYRLGPGSRMPPLAVTDDEAIALAIALRGTSTATVAGVAATATSGVLAKLERLMPAELQRAVADLRETTISMLRTPPAPAEVGSLLVLAHACRDEIEVAFEYTRPGGQRRTRGVEPYRLVQTSHCWYLVGRDKSVADWRTFRVDRMIAVRLTEARFRRLDPPDPERLVTEGMSVNPYSHTATIEVPAPASEVLRFVPRSYGLVEMLDDTRSRVTIGFEHERWLVHFIADLPWNVQVLDPPSVRNALEELGHRLLAVSIVDPDQALGRQPDDDSATHPS